MRDHAAFEQRLGAALATPDAVGDATLARALRVHRNTSAKAAMDALADNYPVLRALCGDEAFAACARDYTTAHPPADPRLCFYGAAMPGFVAAYPPFSDLQWLADVAALERLCIEALFAADADALDGAVIARHLEAAGSLSLHPATRFGAFDAPVAAIWSAHRQAAPEDALSAIEWGPASVLVTRPGGRVIVTAIAAGGIDFLAACAAGASLAEAAAIAAAAGADIAALFSSLITAGAFA